MRSGDAFVYFVSGLGKVKIGSTINLKERLIGLQCGSPIKLTLAALIPACDEFSARRTERDLHRRFKSDKSHGEWFHLSPEVAYFVQSLGDPDEVLRSIAADRETERAASAHARRYIAAEYMRQQRARIIDEAIARAKASGAAA